MTDDGTAIRFVVSGRVQGVGFRMFVRAHALSMGLRGWVRNLPTGEVEAIASGPTDRLAQFKALLWRGPEGAQVSNVSDVATKPPDDLPYSFETRR